MTIDATSDNDRPWAGYGGIEVAKADFTVYYGDDYVSVKNIKRMYAGTFWMSVEDGVPSFEGLNGFQTIGDVAIDEDGFYRVTHGYMVAGGDGFTPLENTQILSITGAKGVKIEKARFSGMTDDGDIVDYVFNLVDPEPPVVPVNFDITGDGVIDQLDLVKVLSWYMVDSNDSNWEDAKACDFNKDGRIDIIDIGLLYHNMQW
jgi:hypothetical protein